MSDRYKLKLSAAAFSMLNCDDRGLMTEWGITVHDDGTLEGDAHAMWIVRDTLEDWRDGERVDTNPAARKRTAVAAIAKLDEVCPAAKEESIHKRNALARVAAGDWGK